MKDLLSVLGQFNHVGLGADEARWRRSGGFIAQSPGRRQGTILVPIAAWHYCPAAGRCGLGTFWIDDATSGSRRRIAVAATQPAENRRCSDATEGGAVESSSSRRDDSCRAEQSPFGRAIERFVSERLQRGER